MVLDRRSFLLSAASSAIAPAAARPAGGPVVALFTGDDRRRNVRLALEAIDDQIRARLRHHAYVLVKPNDVAVNNQLGSTHADALRGILDYLEPRWRGPVVIAESSRDNTHDAFDHFGYRRLPAEYRRCHIQLVDLNEEQERFIPHQIVDKDLHAIPVRLAGRLFDHDAFVLGCALLKVHDYAVATLSVKNLVMAAPLHSPGADPRKFHHKALYHAGYRQMHLNLLSTARLLQPYWNATVIDGFEGMQGAGPLDGTPVPSRLAIASTDPVAADRVGVEVMGINPEWVGYLNYCAAAGLGVFDLSSIQLRGNAAPAAVRRIYQLHPRIERQLEWMGPLKG
ncbi:MAG: DUF362 domain-containing protein [Bryobacteraceae bacterium]